MKKTLFLTLLLLICFTVTVFAAEKNDEQLASDKVLDAIKEIRYAVKAGTNITHYRELVQNAAIEYERFKDKYSKSEYPAFMSNMTIDVYKTAFNIWRRGVFGKPSVIFSDDEAFARYPVIKSKINPVPGTKWYSYEDVLHALWSLAMDFEKDLYKPATSQTETPH